jgi:predicted RNA-binding protein with PUA-like domain
MSGSIIRIKRSAVPGKKPQVSDLQTGELALNTFDAELYVKRVRAGIGTDIVKIGVGATVTNILYVTKDGNDTNTGKKLGDAKATIKGAVADSSEGTVVKVSAGVYIEDNPIVLPDNVSVVGDSLREVSVIPQNQADLFHVGKGCYVAEMSYLPLDGQSLPYAIFAFDPNNRRYIDQSPYIQNCTNFIPESIGLQVDGTKALGPLKSMVLDSYTQYNPNGVGASMTNEGYAQLVSLFTICDNIAVYCGSGGACDLTNSNSSFGNYGLVADGVGPLKYKGVLSENLEVNQDTFVVDLSTPTLKIVNASYDNTTGLITAYTNVPHEFSVGMNVELNNLGFQCSPIPSPINVINAVYDRVSGIATIYTQDPHNLVVGLGVSVVGLGFTCPSGPGIVTYPSGNLGYDFKVLPIGFGNTFFAINVGTSTLPHTYVSGGKVFNLYEYFIEKQNRNVTNAIYDHVSGIATITLSGDHNFSVGYAAKIVGLGFTCPSGPGIVTYPSGNLGYVFKVDKVVDDETFSVNVGASTLPHTYVSGGTVESIGRAYPSGKSGNIFRVSAVAPGRYLDAYDSIVANKKEIQDKSLAAIAIQHPDFYFPGDEQTNPRSRYYDAYRLIQKNRQEIVDKSLSSIAVGFPSNFYFPDQTETNSRSRYYDAHQLIINNRQYIVDAAWNAAVTVYPGISSTQQKCKRDLGFFIDAIATDVFTGGNKYSRDFTLQYFNNGTPISNGLVGEEIQSNYAFNEAANLMKLAITNNLPYVDLSITADPDPNSYPPPYGIPGYTIGNDNPYSCVDVQDNIDNLVGIVTSVIGAGNTSLLLTFNENLGISTILKCARDLGYLVDAISTDVFTGGNKYSRDFTKQYFNNGVPISNGLVGEVSQSLYAFNSVKSYAKKAVTNQLNYKDVGISSGPSIYGGVGIALTVYPSGNPDSCADVQTNIDNLVGIVTSVIGSGSLSYLTSFNENSGLFDESITKCQRDIGYIIDAVAKDIRDFTNENSIKAAKFYFEASGNSLLTNGVFGEVQESITAFKAVRDYSKLAINNQLNNKNFSLVPDPLTGSNNNINSCANIQSNIDNLVGIITTTLSIGNLSSLPSVSYGSTIFTTNVGVSTLPHFYKSGGIVKINIIRPFDGEVVYFDDLYFSVTKVTVIEGGSGYVNVPEVVIDPPTTEWGIPAQAVVELRNGSIVGVELVSNGRGYTSLPRVNVISSDVGITTAKVEIQITPTYYFITKATPVVSGITTVTVTDNLPYSSGIGTSVYFYKQSRVLASGHSLEYIGSGTEINDAIPFNGGVPIQENETESIDGGIVVFTSTDQSGNFRIGDGVIVNQATGTISGVFYSKSLFSTITPFILALGGD